MEGNNMNRFLFLFVPIFFGLIFSSCSGNYTVLLGDNNNADISFNTNVDSATLTAVTDKLKSLSSSDIKNEQVSFFDQIQFTKGLNSLKGVNDVSVKKETQDRISGSFSISDLTKLEPSNSSTKLFTITHYQGKKTLIFTLTKSNAKTAFQLFPGINASLIDALSPPALYEDELTQDEYRQNLLLFFGKNHISAVDTSKYTITLIIPGHILSSSGLSVSGNKATCTFSLLDLLVLNKPIQFQITWN
jgi:hypothetical protein